jgi:hypothetical protein
LICVYTHMCVHIACSTWSERRSTCDNIPHTSAYVSTRQHTSAYASIVPDLTEDRLATTYRIRQHTSAYVSIRQHTSAYVSIRQHTSAYVSIVPDLRGDRLGTRSWQLKPLSSQQKTWPYYRDITRHPTLVTYSTLFTHSTLVTDRLSPHTHPTRANTNTPACTRTRMHTHTHTRHIILYCHLIFLDTHIWWLKKKNRCYAQAQNELDVIALTKPHVIALATCHCTN